MVGGHAPGELDEVLYRFDFPERPGALMHFLTQMGRRPWNISMFHYRNHGSDYWPGADRPSSAAGRTRRLPVIPSSKWGTTTGRRPIIPPYRLFLR